MKTENLQTDKLPTRKTVLRFRACAYLPEEKASPFSKEGLFQRLDDIGRNVQKELDAIQELFFDLHEGAIEKEGGLRTLGDYAEMLLKLREIKNNLAETRKLLDTGANNKFSIYTRTERILHVAMLKQKLEKIHAAGATFTVGGKFIPTLPEPGPLLDELTDWMNENGYGDLLKTELRFTKMAALCKELTERGEPLPPNIETTLQPSIGIRKK